MDLRNIAIIAHVDHGKTDLIDELLKQSGAFRVGQQVAERAMDSNDLERRSAASRSSRRPRTLEWKGPHGQHLETRPGHAIPRREVEASLSMADGG